MGVFRQFPYSNFHEMNMDEILKIVKTLSEEWDATRTEWASYKEFIDNYFENLDVSQEVLDALRILASTGELNQIIDPTIASETAEWLAEHITPTTPAIDSSLTVSGAGADAKTVGDWLNVMIRYISAGQTLAPTYSNLLANIDTGIIFYASTNDWTDTPGYNGSFVSIKTSDNEMLQLFRSIYGVIYTRRVNFTTHTPIEAWKPTSSMNYITSGQALSSTYSNLLANIDTGIIFYANTNDWTDAPGYNGSFISIKTSDNEMLQLFRSIYGVIYTRRVNFTTHTAVEDWKSTVSEMEDLQININNFGRNWARGYIDTNSGEIMETNTAISTLTYFEAPFTAKIETGKGMRVLWFDSNDNVVGNSGWITHDFVATDTNYKYKFSMRVEPYVSSSYTYIDEYYKLKVMKFISGYNFELEPYKGKKVSILGDSISTWQGYIPSGNVDYYPTSRIPDMYNIEQTWWKQVIEHFGFDLLVNNSSSGSRVAITGDKNAYARANQLGSNGVDPDIIFFFMGTNDFNTNVTIGTYDGHDAEFPPITATQFRPSYANALKRMMETYPKAKVYCMTILNCERMGELGFPERNDRGLLADYNTAIKDLADLFGAEVIDVNKCGITYFNLSEYMGDYDYPETGQGLHPNKKGHALIADMVIQKLS